ncbi:Ig-like domain repeat protein [Cellulomonas pakistanensis]|uniref:Bacterial Ig-like domain-containing protein n=1 Tax=Cellulomonas pakistanensis TaxID=992287 RepID=A0A919U6I2_9CELL|nr:Ig-like domain repeat protein [Cellulomonas pakistanensis]GIG37029.1 hypothetical protein Cpa01nite_24100 [Cellulomonas pakistanensis]
MPRSPRRAALALALAATLTTGTAGAALAGPKAPAPKPPAKVTKVVKVAAQVTLRVTPVASTPQATDHRAVVTVKAPKTVVTGSYQLLDGGTVVGSGALVSGAAGVPLDLAPGTHRLTAVYSGTAKVNGAGSKVVVVPVPVPVAEPDAEPVAPAEG